MTETSLLQFYKDHSRYEATDFRFVGLKKLIQKRLINGPIIDVGCGSGALVKALSQEGWDALGIEPDEKIFELADHNINRMSSKPLIINKRIEVLEKDFLAPYRNILLVDVLEHLEDAADALRTLISGMHEEAQLICLVPALNFLYGARDAAVGHKCRYSKTKLIQIFRETGYSVSECRYWNILGVPVYWFFEKVLTRPVPETVRTGRVSPLSRMMNWFMTKWFLIIENKFRFPMGLSLLIRAQKGNQ
jgi:SAM-dependent methyltransferase